MQPIRVLIADDDPSIREALADMLGVDPSLQLVGAAADADQAIELACGSRPDVAILDVRMPGGGGPRAAREIRRCSPETRVVAFSAHEERAVVMDMLRAGAVGYLVKGSDARDILRTIRGAVLGHGALSAEVTADVIHELTGQLERQERETEDLRRQTERVQRAIGGEGLSTVYQPIAELHGGRVVGVEALARFSLEPQEGPVAWFAAAAAAGLETELDLAAIRTALADAPRLPQGVFLSLNLSPATAASTALLDLLADAPVDRIVLEVTEHAPVEDYEGLDTALKDLRARGGRLAVDDAGAGFASLRHILRLAPDFIKLDVDLTRGIDTDQARRALAAALISFASQIGATIVAEGIETRPEVDTLRALGVSYGQGYFIAHPGGLPLKDEVIPALLPGGG